MGSDNDAGYQIIIALRRVIRAIEIHSKRLEREFGLTVPQLLILKEIGVKRDVSASRLAEVLSMSQATTTTIVDRLEQHGFIERIRSTEDKRVVFVCPTERATKVLDREPPVLEERFVRELDALEEWEKTLILSSIQRIAAMMNAEKTRASPALARGEDHMLEEAHASQAGNR